MNTVQKGKQGERVALKYLCRHEYKIVDKNYYSRWGEIDIIAYDKKEKELVFIEVKSRGSDKYGLPENAVDENKLERLFRTAETYLLKNYYEGNYRFDCLAIEFNYRIRLAKIKHYKNIS